MCELIEIDIDAKKFYEVLQAIRHPSVCITGLDNTISLTMLSV